MWKKFDLLDIKINSEWSGGLMDELFAGGGRLKTAPEEEKRFDVPSTYGLIKTLTSSSADAVRALKKECQKWQDAALCGGLPETLPKHITAQTMAYIEQKAPQGNLTSLLSDLPGPYVGGKYAEIAIVGLLDDFENTIIQSWLVKRNFHDVEWWCISDNVDTWIQLEFHAPFYSFMDMVLNQEQLEMMQSIISPDLVIQSKYKDIVMIEDMIHNPFMGIGHADKGEQPDFEPDLYDKSIEEWVAFGEIVLPIMPVDNEQWKKARIEAGADVDIKKDGFTLESSKFLELVIKHQKACNRFAHGLFALNVTKEG